MRDAPGLREDVTAAGTDIRRHYGDETARYVAYFMQAVYALPRRGPPPTDREGGQLVYAS